jgi:hypothetical protein
MSIVITVFYVIISLGGLSMCMEESYNSQKGIWTKWRVDQLLTTIN